MICRTQTKATKPRPLERWLGRINAAHPNASTDLAETKHSHSLGGPPVTLEDSANSS